MEYTGYPVSLYIVVGLVGLLLALLRPELGLFAGLVLYGGLEHKQATFTRIEPLGPYCNLLDVVIVILVVAAVKIKWQDKVPFNLPLRILAVLAVLLLGFLRVVYAYGCQYEILRAARWAACFPLLFAVGSLVRFEGERSRRILLALYLGAIMACAVYLIRVRILQDETAENFENIRDSQFIYSAALPLLLVSLCAANYTCMKSHKWLHLTNAILCSAAIILSQARSVYLTIAVCLFIVPLVFRVQRRQFSKTVGGLVVILFGLISAGIVLSVVLPSMDILELVTRRFASEQFSSGGRSVTLRGEFADWWKGSLLFGNGLWYIRDITNRISGYGHLGWLTILAQLGLVGLACYAYTVGRGIWECKRVVESTLDSVDRFIVLVAGTTLVTYSVMFFMSGTFLGEGTGLTGFLAGLVWSRHWQLFQHKYQAVWSVRPGHSKKRLPNAGCRLNERGSSFCKIER